MKIIDAHMHIIEYLAGNSMYGELRAYGNGLAGWANGEKWQMWPSYMGSRGVSAETVLSLMNRMGVEKAVLMQGPTFGYQNEFAMEAATRYPDRFLPACIIDFQTKYFDDIMRRFFNELGFKVFKMELSEMCGEMGFHSKDYFQNKNVDTLCEKLEEIKGSFALDLGTEVEASYQIKNVAELADKYPNTKFIICHLLEPEENSEKTFVENIEMLNKKNIWMDLSAFPSHLNDKPPFNKSLVFLKDAREILGANKLLWASDSPGALVHNSYEDLLKIVTDYGVFTPDEQKKVLYDNAFDAYPFKA